MGIQIHIGRHSHTCTEVGVGGHIVWSRPGVLISFCPTGAQVYSCSFCKCANEWKSMALKKLIMARNVLNGIQESKISLLFLGLLLIKTYDFVAALCEGRPLLENWKKKPATDQSRTNTWHLFGWPCQHVHTYKLKDCSRLSIHISGGLRKHAVNMSFDQDVLQSWTAWLHHLNVNLKSWV